MTVEVSLQGAAGRRLAPARRGRSVSGHPRVCGYLDPSANYTGEGPFIGMDTTAPFTDPQDGQAYVLACFEMIDGARGPMTYSQWVTWDPAQPWGAVDAGSRAAEVARDALVVPETVLGGSPMLDRDLLVGVPTWFWVTSPWAPLMASAAIGGVTATVTATPVSFTVVPGDGGALVRCAGPGTVWHPGDDPRTSSCAHTYTDRSTVADPQGTYTITAEVTWDVTWTATNGETGALDPIVATSARPVIVREAQAVIR